MRFDKIFVVWLFLSNFVVMEEKDKRPLIGMTLDDFAAVAEECGLPRFAAKQIADWIYVKRVMTIGAMTNLSLKGRQDIVFPLSCRCDCP